MAIRKKGEESSYPPPVNNQEMPFQQGEMSEQYPTGPPPSPGNSPGGVPVEQVINLRQQGLSNNQIVQTMQKDGYDSGQIFDAMNQADMQGGTGAPQPIQAGMPQQDFLSPPNAGPPPMQSLPPLEGMPPPPGADTKIEEIAEAIINEKWEELTKNLSKLHEWKDQTENRISKIEQQFVDLKTTFDKLHQAIIGKIGDYDKNILSVGTEIKAMEKVFQKILPTFTENVAELSRITRRVKGK